jgi:hypothetical protein
MHTDYLDCKEIDRETKQPARYRCFGCSRPKSDEPQMLPSFLGTPMPYCIWCAHVKGGGD